MNSESSVKSECSVRPASAVELQNVEGGLVLTSQVYPMGDRVIDGCGTMILLDRLISIFRGGRR